MPYHEASAGEKKQNKNTFIESYRVIDEYNAKDDMAGINAKDARQCNIYVLAVGGL